MEVDTATAKRKTESRGMPRCQRTFGKDWQPSIEGGPPRSLDPGEPHNH